MMARAIFLLLVLLSGVCRIAAQIPCGYERGEVPAGRACQRACSADGTCRKQNRECECDGRCGPSCLKKACPLPEQPINGSFIIRPDGRFIGSEAIYSCDVGYVLVGNASRTCQTDKIWSGTDPACNKSAEPVESTSLPAVCERLPAPLNGIVTFSQESGGAVAEDTVATFECNHGYSRASGNLRRNCQPDGSWSGNDVVCSADVPCLRNDQEIQNQNRQCLRQCESDGDCHRDRRCVCDDICGLACIRIDRANHCDHLSSDQRVRVRITPNNRTFGSIARYECRVRHEQMSGSNERRCLGFGQWSGRPLNCIPIDRCDQPPEIENSAHNGTKDYYIEGEIVMYSCHNGYYRSGYLPLSRCNGNEWSEIQFQCSPKSCGDPGHVLNSRRHGASFIFRGSVEYTCNLGYELRGLSRRYCQANQQWSGYLPTCHAVRCPAPGVLDNGRKIGSDFSYNEIVSFECNTRYLLRGQRYLRCQANGTWDAPQPTCTLIQCPRPEDPDNGQSDVDFQSYGYQGTIRYTCNSGYALRGSSVITCNENEEWSPPPPLCLGQCRIPPCPTHGRWTISNSQRYSEYCPNYRFVDSGTRLTYRCNTGYFKCQQRDPVCQDLEWDSNVRSLCKPLGCNFVTPRDRQLQISYTVVGESQCVHERHHQRGTVIEYSCNIGYKIRDGDPRQSTCNVRTWSPQRQPTCEEVNCPSIRIANGGVNYQQNGPFTSLRGHNAVARFFCGQGYMLDGRNSVVCDNGIWNDTIARCMEEPCSVFYLYRYDLEVVYRVPPGSGVIEEVLKPAGTSANFICERGFEASQTKICQLGGWTGPDPECSRIPCDDERLVYGDVSYTLDDVEVQSPVHGVVRSFGCNAGFIVNVNETSQCDAGIWTISLPVCNEKSCNKNDLPSGDWETEFDYPGGLDVAAELMKPPRTVARFTCYVVGYVMAGDDTKTCRLGEWDGPNLFCERRLCRPIQLEHGRFEYWDIDNRPTFEPRHGDTRISVCEDGYNLQGTSAIRCWDGDWEDELPSCEEKPCNKNELPSGDWEIEFDYPGGLNEAAELMKPPRTVARFTCNVIGYVIDGDDTKTCRLGEWDGPNLFCERRVCQTFVLKKGGFEYRYSDNTSTLLPRHGDTRTATCEDGYHLQGTIQARCWEGQWEGEQPTCQENPCRFLNDVPDNLQVRYATQNGTDISADEEFVPSRSVATFSCTEEGLTIGRDSDSTRVCKRGRWKGPFPECVNAFCSIETIENGNGARMNGSRFTQEASHGDWRRFTCERGYTLVGEEWSQCRSGVWHEEKPSCEEASCQAVENNGEYAHIYYTGTTSLQLSFPANTFLEVECTEGRVAEGPTTSVCRRGLWDPPRLICMQYVSCTVVDEEGGRTIVYNDNSRDLHQHNSRLDVTCESRMVRFGEESSTCLNGIWIPPVAKCFASCEEVTEEEGRTIVYTDNPENQRQHNSRLAVTCEGQMVRLGQDMSTCFNGTWVPPAAHCKENFALGNVAEQDSTTFSGDADRAVDGNTNGIFFVGNSCTHTSGNTGNRWWYVDLGSTILVQEIVIYNRQEGNQHRRLLNATVRVGEQTGSDVTQNQLAGTVNDTEINPIHIAVNPAIEGRIVSVSKLTSETPLTLCEVQVFGEILGPACSNGCQVPQLENGYFTLQVYNGVRLQPMTCVPSGSHVVVNCQQGLHLRGTHYYTCQSSGEWLKPNGEDATCQRCLQTQCLVPYIENGQYSYTRGGNALINGSCTSRTYLYVDCDDGMQLSGEDFYFCREGELMTRNPGNTFSTCTRGISNEREQQCPSPGVSNLVETFVGSEHTPLDDQETFREGDFITSRCQDPMTQKLRGSVIRRCEGGQWTGDPARCVSTNFAISVGNTVLKNVTENGTMIVYPVRGYVIIGCRLQNGLAGIINIYKDDELMLSAGSRRTEKRSWINNPSPSNNGTYRCENDGESHSIVILFKAISCPPPEEPDNGFWRHNLAGANPNGHLGYIFMETLSLICDSGYRLNDSTRPTCSYHGTWINMSQRCIRHPGP